MLIGLRRLFTKMALLGNFDVIIGLLNAIVPDLIKMQKLRVGVKC
jgi:hypothetical protein